MRWFFSFSLLVLAVIVAVFLFLPQFASSPALQSVTLRFAAPSGFEVRAEKLQLSWFGSQYLSHVNIYNSHGEKVLHADAVAIHQSLIKTLLNRTIHGSFSLNGFTVLLDADNSSWALFEGTDKQQAIRVQVDSINVVPAGILYKVQGAAEVVYKGDKGSLEIDGIVGTRPEQFLPLPYFSLQVKELPIQVLTPFVPKEYRPLIGLYPKGKVNALVNKTDDKLVVQLASPIAQANFEASIENGYLNLTKPGNIFLSLPKNQQWRLPFGEQDFEFSTTAASSFQIAVKEALLPIAKSLDEAKFSIESRLTGVQVDSSNIPFPIYAEKVVFTSQLENKQVSSLLDIEAKSADKPIHLKFNSRFPVPSTFLKWLEYLFQQSHFELTTRQFPLELIDSISQFTSTPYLGDYIDVSFDYSATERRGELSLHSDRVFLSKAPFTYHEDILTLERPVNFQVTIPKVSDPLFSVLQPVKVNVELTSLVVPFQKPSSLLLKAQFSTGKNLRILSPLLEEKQIVSSLQGTAVFQELWKADAQLQIFPQADSEATESISLSSILSKKAGFQGSTILFDAKTDALKGKMDLVVSSPGILALKSPANFDYYPTIATAKALGVGQRLLPPKIRCKLQQFELPFLAERPLNAKGEFSFGNFSTGPKERVVLLEKMSLPFRVQNSIVDLKAVGTAEIFEKKTTFQSSAKLQYAQRNLPFFSALRMADFTLQDMPQDLLALFIPSVERLITSPVNGIVYYEDIDDVSDGSLFVDLESKNAHVKGKFTIAESHVIMDQSTPFSLSIKVDETALQEVRKQILGVEHYVTMVTPTDIDLQLTQFTIPRDNGTLAFHKGSYSCTFLAKPLHFFDKILNQNVQFQQLQATVSANPANSLIEAQLSLLPKAPLSQTSYLQFQASLENGFDNEGNLRLDLGKLVVKGSSNDLRSVSFCGLFCPYPGVVQKLDALIGEPLDAEFFMSMEKKNGVISGSGSGANGSISIDGRVQNGVLLLNAPLTATIRVTDQLGPFVMSDVAPLFSGLYKSNSPLKLTIAERGFAFPIFNYSFDKIRIGAARFDMGQLTFSHSQQIKAILGVLGASSPNEVMVWLTPAFFSLQSGWVDLRRMDALIDNKHHIALWGKVNLLTDEISMTVGLSQETLEKAFNVKGIRPGAMLQVPLRGTTKRPKLDRAEASAKVAALLATSRVPNGVIGTIVDIASEAVINPSPPPPSVNPLPWGNQVEETKEDSIKEKAVDKIEKEAKKLLKKIF